MGNVSHSSGPAAADDDSPSLTVLAAYGALAFPLAAAFIALQVIVPTFYAQALGLSLTAVGGILLTARLWDMFTDPLVGYLSDRTPAAWGRRKIWVVASAIVAVDVEGLVMHGVASLRQFVSISPHCGEKQHNLLLMVSDVGTQAEVLANEDRYLIRRGQKPPWKQLVSEQYKR